MLGFIYFNIKESYLSIVYFKESHIDFQVLTSVPGLVYKKEDILR